MPSSQQKHLLPFQPPSNILDFLPNPSQFCIYLSPSNTSFPLATYAIAQQSSGCSSAASSSSTPIGRLCLKPARHVCTPSPKEQCHRCFDNNCAFSSTIWPCTTQAPLPRPIHRLHPHLLAARPAKILLLTPLLLLLSAQPFSASSILTRELVVRPRCQPSLPRPPTNANTWSKVP